MSQPTGAEGARGEPGDCYAVPADVATCETGEPVGPYCVLPADVGPTPPGRFVQGFDCPADLDVGERQCHSRPTGAMWRPSGIPVRTIEGAWACDYGELVDDITCVTRRIDTGSEAQDTSRPPTVFTG